MLMSSQIDRYAHQILDARASGKAIPPLSGRYALTLEDGYEIARRVLDLRIAQGENPIGRKIGFASNIVRQAAEKGCADASPVWAHVFDSTVHEAEDNIIVFSLGGMQQPRIEPEIVFKLRKAPPADATPEMLADCIEWMAHGIEITSSIFPDRRLDAADVAAAFGLHGALLIGEPRVVSEASRHSLGVIMASASVSLSCDGSLLAAGFGSETLNGPLHALWLLHRILVGQSLFPPLAAGEIVTTGSWTYAYPVAPGQTWQTAFSALQLEGMTVSLTE